MIIIASTPNRTKSTFAEDSIFETPTALYFLLLLSSHPFHSNIRPPPPKYDGQDGKNRAQKLEGRDVIRNVQL